jgi:hypothetical protein
LLPSGGRTAIPSGRIRQKLSWMTVSLGIPSLILLCSTGVRHTFFVGSFPFPRIVNGSTKDRFIPPYFFVLQELLPFCRDISFPCSRHVLLSPLFLSLLVSTVGWDLPCFLSHSVVDHLGPYCLFGGIYTVLGFGGLRPLVDGPVGWRAPRQKLIFQRLFCHHFYGGTYPLDNLSFVLSRWVGPTLTQQTTNTETPGPVSAWVAASL